MASQGEAAERVTTAFRIFNGVFQAVQEFLETPQPALLVLAAKHEDLASIYALYLRREAAHIAELGYGVEGPVRMYP